MSRPPPNIVLPAKHTRAFGIVLPMIDGELIDDFRLLKNLRVLALLGLGSIPDRVMADLSPAGLVTLAELRSEIARSLYLKEPLTDATTCATAETVNAGCRVAWWPAQAGPYDETNGKLPEFGFTLAVPALWGLYTIRTGCQMMAFHRYGSEKRRMTGAAEAAHDLCTLLGAEIGEPYPAGRGRPTAGEIERAWHHFEVMVAWVPGLQVLPLMLVKDDLPALLPKRVSPAQRPKPDDAGEES